MYTSFPKSNLWNCSIFWGEWNNYSY